jgi:hypothetical protein
VVVLDVVVVEHKNDVPFAKNSRIQPTLQKPCSRRRHRAASPTNGLFVTATMVSAALAPSSLSRTLKRLISAAVASKYGLPEKSTAPTPPVAALRP